MGRKLGKNRQFRKELTSLKSEEGYLMLSTLFLLVLTGLFLQGVIKISTNHIIQLNQISSAYQAKTALNMSERILKDYILENSDELPAKANISSSVGNIEIKKNTSNDYDAVITQNNGMQFNKTIKIDSLEDDGEEIQDGSDVLNEAGLD